MTALYSDEQKKLGFNEFFEALSQETKDWWTKNVSTVLLPQRIC